MRQVCAGQISSHGRILALALAERDSHVDEWACGRTKPLAAVIGYAPGMRQPSFNPDSLIAVLAEIK